MRLKPPTPLRALASDERGFTMFFALMVMLVSSLLAAAAFLATNEDVALTRSYGSQQKAYYAALAGIDEYKFQLSANPNYWQTCPKLAKAAVPGATEEEDEATTLGANGHALCTSGAQPTIIETSGTASGTFRIESTGFSGGKRRSIVATFTHPGFLNYAWVSNYEVEDPSTFTPEPKHCAFYYNERKEIAEGKKELEGKKWPKELEECPAIPFIGVDGLNGPFHTNDAVSLCSEFAGSPSFGREGHVPPDNIEFDQSYYRDTLTGGCGEGHEFFGKYSKGGATLFPPGTDNELLATAEAKFKGRTVIELESATKPNTMKVTTWNFSTNKPNAAKVENIPKNGVIYVENGEKGCEIKYSPFVGDKNYEENEKEPGASCGNVYVKGSYTESLTIAAQNDVIVIGSITTTHEGEKGKPLENATLGLIANGFVRIYHPETQTSTRAGCSGGAVNQNKETDFRKWGSLEEPVIDAAILSTDHSWIVDNFMCGANLGELTVWGVIAQDWRGRVTAGSGGAGYAKNYNYDERLKTKQPPNFLSPTTTSWYISRETQPCEGKTTAEGGKCTIL